ncbi:MAG: TetR/AcrR family transcriptional regulator [Desulfohalobiaceae bacterium]|nr:TetR/AcrR family transcriptional regulator [Desulfohalobiaceae bacterium]
MRNAEATRKLLIQAVGSLLARKGFTAIGVNALAREAKVDKVLIYRYFDGLPGLIQAFGREGGFWPSDEELMGGRIEDFLEKPVRERLQRLALNFLQSLRRRPLTLEIMAWEMVEKNELTEELERIREQSILAVFSRGFPEKAALPDIEAMAAIVGAAISYLVLRARNTKWYTGLNLQDESGWHRLELAFCELIDGLVGN